MCKYCSTDANGDIPEDRESMFNIKAGEMIGADIGLIGDVVGERLELEFTPFTVLSGKQVSVPIRYCPMCGRKLAKGYPRTMDPDLPIDEVEKALGFTLYPWQISYIEHGVWRRGGFSTAKCLRRLLKNDGFVQEYVRQIKRSHLGTERFEEMMLIDIMRKLQAAGIKCNTYKLVY